MENPTDDGNDGRYPDGCPVLTPFPVTDEEIAGGRASWPWLPATILSQCGPDEWELVLEAPGAIKAAGDGTGDDLYPVVFRDRSEIRLPDPAVGELREIFFREHGDAVNGRDEHDLDQLRWHWDTAYLIHRLGGRWVAQRRDSRETISSDTAAGLLEAITRDYQARPVARRNGGGQ